jgi:hypothetical protein
MNCPSKQAQAGCKCSTKSRINIAPVSSYLKRNFATYGGQPGRDAARKYLQDWILKGCATGIQPLKKLANTLLTQARQIHSYFDRSINSGIMGGQQQDRTAHPQGLWLP